MATPDPRRRSLYARLEEVLGNTDAETLMTYLPQDPGSEIATKADIAVLAERFDRLEIMLDGRFGQLDSRFEQVDHRFEQIDHRFEQIDHRFDRLDARVAATEVGVQGLRDDFRNVRTEFGGVRDDLRDQLKVYSMTTIGAMTALTAIFGAMVAVFT